MATPVIDTIRPIKLSCEIYGMTVHVRQVKDEPGQWYADLMYKDLYLVGEVIDDANSGSRAMEKAIRWVGDAIADLVATGELVLIHKSEVTK